MVCLPHIGGRVRRSLQIAGLAFLEARAEALRAEACLLRIALEAGSMNCDDVDDRLIAMEALGWVYPEWSHLNDGGNGDESDGGHGTEVEEFFGDGREDG